MIPPNTPFDKRVAELVAAAKDPLPEVSYAAFVGRLIKPADVLVAEATPLKMALNHLICGFSGELGELLEGVDAYDIDNLFEEFGDLEFYWQDMDARLRGFEHESFFDSPVPETNHKSGEGLFGKLVVAVSCLVDTLKRHTIYNNPLDVQKAWKYHLIIRSVLDAYYLYFGFTREAVIAANKTKLNKRYNLTVGYTDHAATARADKA